MTKAVITNLTDTTTNVNAMVITNDNFDNLNAQLPEDVDWAIVSRLGTQTLTNKTLTNPTVTTGTFTSPALVTPALGTPASGNLANCTFPTLNQNTTGSANSLKNATTSVSTAAATAPTAWQILKATSDSLATWQDEAGGYWDFKIKLAADFVVTNNSTLQDVTGFTLPVVNGEVWYVEIWGSTAASDATGDIKADVVNTGTWEASGYYKSTFYNGSGTIQNQAGTNVSTTTSTLGAGGLVVNNGDTVVRPIFIALHVVVSGSGNIKLQIANVAASSGRTSTLKAGSYMLARKLSV